MNVRQLLILGASALMSSQCGPAPAEERQAQYVQIAELEIDPAQLAAYKAAAREQIETAIRVEPRVLVLYLVSQKDNPAHITVFEIYADTDAYKAHLESAHFKKYKTTTDRMVKSLKLIKTDPVILGAKAR